MKLTCTQMDVLLSFYIENELSNALKVQVEEHLQECKTCRAKYDIIKSMFVDLQSTLEPEGTALVAKTLNTDADNGSGQKQYHVFKNNLSAYIDNELSNDENIKMKKFTISNKNARKDLEDSYNIRKLINDSFRKTKSEAKHDFTRSIMRQLEMEEEAALGFHPAIKLLIAFTASVLILTTIILISLNI